MFTGLIDDVGRIERIDTTPAGLELAVACRYGDLSPGESIALNGACLTVRECGPQWFTVAAVTTTLGRTTIGAWTPGRRVNLERALRLGDRLGGHIVQGHVDQVAVVQAVRSVGDARLIAIALAERDFPRVVPYGSIAIDGVSLTVNALPSRELLELSLIEYTLRHTTLGALAAGEMVQVEFDVIGKYAQKAIDPYLVRDPLLAVQ